jgi:NAD(P)H-nitrite reductase large subunit
VVVGKRAGDVSIRRVVVIGNGIAGVTSADHVRRRHSTCEIDVISRERHHLYNRMAITRLIYGRSAMQNLYLLKDQWYDENRITTWLNTQVVAIDREQDRVVLGTGDSLPYDRLILTAGSRNFIPQIDGFGRVGTFALREAEDAMRIRAFIQESGARQAVVAGAGPLGLEAAHALKRFGLHVTVLQIGERLLPRQLDVRGSQFLLKYLEGLGLDVIVLAQTASVRGNGTVTGVTLEDGREIDADLFLVCAGITPNVEIAQDAGLEVNRGVIVDDRMQTSDPKIFAAGDAAEFRGHVSGQWPTAVKQGEVAALNALGGEERYVPMPAMTILKVTGVDLTSIGRFEPESDDDSIIVQEDMADRGYRKLVIRDGKIVGAILLGYSLEAPGIDAAVRLETDMRPWLDRLRAGDWSMFVEQEWSRIATALS